MSSTNEVEDAVAQLWQEHAGAPFPAGLAGAERAGIDLVLLDADIAGCVSSRQNSGGFLDAGRRRILDARTAELERILPLLGAADGAPYWQRLYRLARLVADAGE
ncbi:hypothetical protein [Streptomyces rubiginosohelvolus]|uniref:hypothetical protein n=1 Tax=Streptomyces rubiginosohelvolus TaxID=67362 RepID=UPI00364F353F